VSVMQPYVRFLGPVVIIALTVMSAGVSAELQDCAADQ